MPANKTHTFITTTVKVLVLVLGLYITASTALADTTPPVTTYTQSPASPDGNNNWYVSPVEFELTATDLESGVKEINYRVDGGSWQKTEFSNSLNLAPNPSFETAGATTTNIADWEASVVDGNATYSRDTGLYYTGFASSSAKIAATLGPWHGINNQAQFAVANPYDNMSASVWVKTDSITGSAYFKMYSVSQDGSGVITYVDLGQSPVVTGTTDWTNISLNFVVNDPNSIGVYMDLGLDTSGTLWADAAVISESLTSANTNVTISTDSESHTLEFYSVDTAGNTEAYSCPLTNCVTFKLDQTPPGNWHGSGAIRGLFGSEHEVYVYTEVEDNTSGLSIFSDKYQYLVDTETIYGHYQNLLYCNTAWIPNSWKTLLTLPLDWGVDNALLVTLKTDFCNSNWKICKSVRFYAIDMAGNEATKDFCINGPWIKFRGEGVVRANQNINMVAESDEHNTDGLIEVGGNMMDFFTSSRNWIVYNATTPTTSTYDEYLEMIGSTTTISTNLVSADGAYINNGDYEITNQHTPNDYDNDTFSQVVFIDGDLTISDDIEIADASTALFIVNGDVYIDEKVTDVEIAIFAEGTIYTAYNVEEGKATSTLSLKGIYKADEFNFQRTLQGTQNQNTPSEDFTYEPKYVIQQKDFFGKNAISWKNIN
jgi:hypothetical protein